MMNTQVKPSGKRQYRNMSPEQKQKLSIAHQGKKHPEYVKQRIAQSMQNYWKNLSYAPTTNNNSGTTTSTIYGN